VLSVSYLKCETPVQTITATKKYLTIPPLATVLCGSFVLSSKTNTSSISLRPFKTLALSCHDCPQSKSNTESYELQDRNTVTYHDEEVWILTLWSQQRTRHHQLQSNLLCLISAYTQLFQNKSDKSNASANQHLENAGGPQRRRDKRCVGSSEESLLHRQSEAFSPRTKGRTENGRWLEEEWPNVNVSRISTVIPTTSENNFGKKTRHGKVNASYVSESRPADATLITVVKEEAQMLTFQG